MPANRYGIDVAGLYKDVGAIKRGRLANRMAGVQTREAEREELERPGKELIEAENRLAMQQTRGEAAGGSEEAQRRLLSLDPEGAPAFLEAVDSMDERQRAAVQRSVDELGRLSHYVLQGKDEADQKARYLRMRQNVAPDVQEKLPEFYDPAFMQLSLSKAKTMDQILEAPKAVGIGAEDVTFRGGLEEERAAKPVKPRAGGGIGGLKASDESLMYKQSAELLGGIFSQTGELTNLDPETRNKVQSIATEASRMLQRGEADTRAGAVMKAAKKFGLNVRKPPKPGANDPANIRNRLLNQ